MFPILADEDIDKPIIAKLRAVGIDVESVAEKIKGTSDSEVLDYARKKNRVLVTFDKDYLRLSVKNSPGVIWVSRVRDFDRVVAAIRKVVTTIDAKDIKETVFRVSPR